LRSGVGFEATDGHEAVIGRWSMVVSLPEKLSALSHPPSKAP